MTRPSRPVPIGDGDGDGGTIMLLTLGYLVVALMLVAVVVDVSAVFLARRSLASDCDAASIAAAQQVSQRPLYQGGDGPRLVLDPGVAGPGAAGETLQADVGAGGTTVVVRGRRRVSLPLGHLLGLGSVTVTAASEAQSLTGP